ncbi:MAG TPA: FG-GAP-like repeat-containing protein [Anaerolineae bacterium]|nr:FG-GAP-like repeat-containing protein [Anaerolineae bacterium]
MSRLIATQRLVLIFIPTLLAVATGLVAVQSLDATKLEASSLAAPTFKWSRCPPAYCETGWYASPAAADIDGDGQVEVVWGGYTLMAVNGATGAIEWTAAAPGGGRLWPGIVVADLEPDGDLEIVTGNGSGYITIYNGNGSIHPGWPIRPTSNELRSLAVAHLDTNADLEIVVCSTRSDNQWFVYEHTGALRSGWPRQTDSDSNGYAAGCYNENVGAADLDGDGRGEIIGPNDTHYIAAFNDDGSPLRASALYGQVGGQNKPWARVGVHVDHNVDLRGYADCGVEHRPNFANSAPSIGDVNGDGVLEIVVVGNVYNCGADPYTDLYEMPFIFKADRTRWSGSGYDWTVIPTPDANAAPLSEDYNLIENNLPNPVIADLDGDGRKEILFPSYDGRLHAYWLDKIEKHNWPFEVYTGGAYRFASEPAVADLDGDGKAEVIFTTWPQKGSNQRGDLKIVNWQGTQLFSVPLPNPGDDWGGALPAPTLANIDGDAELEVLIGSTHSGLLAYDLPGTSNANVLWGTGRGSYQRTGQALQGSLAGSGITANTIAPAPGEVVTFTIRLRNAESVGLPGVRMTDTLPAQLTYARGLNATSGNVGRSGNTITWTGMVSSGATISVTFAVTVNPAIVNPTIIVNTATFDDGQGKISSASAGLGVNAYRMYLPMAMR